MAKHHIRQVSSTLLLLLTVSFAGVVIYAYRIAMEGNPFGITLLILLAPITFYSIYSASLFLILYPLGRLNNYVYDRVSGPESPFAGERLPKQIIAPKEPEEAK